MKHPHAIIFENEDGRCTHSADDLQAVSECGEPVAVVYDDGSEGSAEEAKALLTHQLKLTQVAGECACGGFYMVCTTPSDRESLAQSQERIREEHSGHLRRAMQN